VRKKERSGDRQGFVGLLRPKSQGSSVGVIMSWKANVLMTWQVLVIDIIIVGTDIIITKSQVQLGREWQACYDGTLLTCAMQRCGLLAKGYWGRVNTMILVVWHCSGPKPAAIAA